MKVVLVSNGDDWEGLYVDGVLRTEGHEVTARDVLEVFGLEMEYLTPDPEWMAERGSLPDNLSEVKRENA